LQDTFIMEKERGVAITNVDSKSNELYPSLPVVYSHLQEYIIEQTKEYTKLKILRGLIEFEPDLILANFKDCIITMERNNPYNIIKLIHK
jgi:hypothetical protein